MNISSTRQKAHNPVPHVRILYYSEGWGFGGIETFIMNAAKVSVQNGYLFDIFCTHDWSDARDSAIYALGGKRFTVFHRTKPNLVKRLYRSLIEWKRLLETGKYSIVHINTMNGVGFLYAHVAKKLGIPSRIIHSHNTDFGHGARVLKSIVHQASKMFWGSDATERLATSREAGVYLFGKKSFDIIVNGIDTSKLKFDSVVRKHVRASLGIGEQTLVFGTIARLAEAKNPLFQVDILDELIRRNIDARLLLVGSGPMKQSIEEKAANLNLSGKIILVEATSKTAAYFFAMDVATIPSTYEGFGITVIESIASGLPSICSTNIPTFPFTSNLEKRATLGDVDGWANEILRAYRDSEIDREKCAHDIDDAGYGLSTLRRQLENVYSNPANRRS